MERQSQDAASAWHRTAHGLDASALRAVIDGDVAALRVAGFASTAECAAFASAATSATVGLSEAHTSPMQLIGANLSNHMDDGKERYFALARQSWATLGRITAASFDPVTRFVAALEAIWPGAVAIAEEAAPYGRYFAGCIKTRTEPSPVHFDYVPHVARDYAIARIEEQLAWNLYLAMPANSGQTTVYRRPMSRRTPPETVPGKRNFLPREAVTGAERHTFKAAVGDLMIFNSRYPHEIAVEGLQSDERRMQVGGFLGLLPDGDLVLWS